MSAEAIVDPERPIIDPHHHMWEDVIFGTRYMLEDLHADTGSGHNVVKTVFVDCSVNYRENGPEHLKSVGETEFALAQARLSENRPGATIAGIVSRVDLRLADTVREAMEAHIEAGGGLFRGIRHAAAHEPNPAGFLILGIAPADLYLDKEFRRGAKVLGDMDLTFDAWHFYHQNQGFLSFARDCPNTQIILDHFATPLGVGHYAGRRDEIFEIWKQDIAEIAKCDNVVVKMGGMAMPDCGFGWQDRDQPVTSDEFAKAQRRYYLHTIECFGVDRCMMESNFPVDKLGITYPVLYNGMKKIVADFSDHEKHALFYGTAARIYKLDHD